MQGGQVEHGLAAEPEAEGHHQHAGSPLQLFRRHHRGQPAAQQHPHEAGADQGQGRPHEHHHRPSGLRREQQSGELGLVAEFGEKDRGGGGEEHPEPRGG